MAKVYDGNTAKIKLNAGVDISSQTTLDIEYLNPSGNFGSWSATVEDTNYAVYQCSTGDLDIPGTWKVRIYIEMPSFTGRSTPYSFEVYDKAHWT